MDEFIHRWFLCGRDVLWLLAALAPLYFVGLSMIIKSAAAQTPASRSRRDANDWAFVLFFIAFVWQFVGVGLLWLGVIR